MSNTSSPVNSPINVVGIVGSVRARSVNGSVAHAAAAHAPEGVMVSIHSVAEVPLYNGDIEEAGLPASVQALHDAVGEADGLIFFSPEYNGSFPAVTKNVIDWLSRPPRSWEGTAVTMVCCTPGPRAGLGVRTHFSAIMEHQPVTSFETFGIGSYGDKLDDAGALADPVSIAELTEFIAGFAAAIG